MGEHWLGARRSAQWVNALPDGHDPALAAHLATSCCGHRGTAEPAAEVPGTLWPRCWCWLPSLARVLLPELRPRPAAPQD